MLATALKGRSVSGSSSVLNLVTAASFLTYRAKEADRQTDSAE